MKSPHRVGPMVKPRTTKRPIFDDYHFKTLLRCHKRRFAASRPCPNDRKLITTIGENEAKIVNTAAA